MFKLAELFVEIGAKTGGLNAALAGVHSRLLGMGPLGAKLSGGIHAATNAFLGLGSLGPVALGAVAAGAGALAVGVARCAMEAAHLQEAVSKVEQTFGSATPKLLAMADQLASRLGVVRKEILDVAASFGLMLQGAGVGRELSAEMSISLSRMAVDASSFFDVPMQEAIQRMQSGLSGEMEAVRRWGVNLSETNIKRQGQALGFGEGELDQQTKTLIRYTLILEGLSAAAGDAERSQGRLVGQWKLFTGQLSELATNIGTILIPVVTGLLYAFNTLVWAIGLVPKALLSAASILTGWIDAILGTDLSGKAEEAARRKSIDERVAKAEADKKADEEAANKAEAASKAKGKGFQGGLEEWARHVQKAAFGEQRNRVAADQLRAQQAMARLLQEIKDRLPGGGAAPPAPAPAPWW